MAKIKILFINKNKQEGKLVFQNLTNEKEVRIVLFSNGNFLLIKNPAEKRTWPNLWSFPGGSVEKGETEAEAAIRELKEETGITVRSLCFLQCFPVVYGPNFSRWVYLYCVRLAQKPVFNPDTEVAGCPANYCWVNTQSINGRLTPCTEKILDNFFINYEKYPPFKFQT